MTLMITDAAQMSAVGTTLTSAALNGDIIDMANFENIAVFGVQAATNGTAWVKLQTGTATDAMSDTTGDVGDKTGLFIEQHRPNKRYARGVFKAGTTTSAYRTLYTMVYGGRAAPATAQDNASTTGLRVYTPGSGTATG